MDEKEQHERMRLALKGDGAVGVMEEVLGWDEEEDDVPEKILEAREKFKVVRVHAPNLNHRMQPAVELFNMSCPFSKDGKCWTCDDFAGLYTPEGTVFAYNNYEGYCGHGVEDEETT